MTTRDETAHWVHTVAAPTPDWFPQAACRGLDPNLFHPLRGEPHREARQTCAACPVIDDCLEYALRQGFRVGMWGGKSEKERRRLRRNILDFGASA